MKRGPTLVIGILVVVAAGGTAAWYYFGDEVPENSRIFVSGNIEATEVDLSFRLSGQIKMLNAEEGTWLKKDQIVATKQLRKTLE